jgi:hypothetical protein
MHYFLFHLQEPVDSRNKARQTGRQEHCRPQGPVFWRAYKNKNLWNNSIRLFVQGVRFTEFLEEWDRDCYHRKYTDHSEVDTLEEIIIIESIVNCRNEGAQNKSWDSYVVLRKKTEVD